MHRVITKAFFCALCFSSASANEMPPVPPRNEQAEQAERMNAIAKSRLAPVYPALAEWLVARYEMESLEGVGIDLGGGPGDLIVELCARTDSMFWINADINPFSFPFMYRSAVKAGIGERVGAVLADAHDMPFKDDYADIIVSRGTFQFFEDKEKAFGEIHRILKPGGAALIGRGYSENLPPSVAAAIREAHGDGGPAYRIDETAMELRAIMKALDIREYEIIVPKNDERPDVKYGIWLEFRKRP